MASLCHAWNIYDVVNNEKWSMFFLERGLSNFKNSILLRFHNFQLNIVQFHVRKNFYYPLCLIEI